MANTTTVILSCVDCDEDASAEFKSKSGLDLAQLLDDSRVTNGRVVCHDVWAITVRTLDYEKQLSLIELFKGIKFKYPEYASLTLDCDDIESLSKIYIRDTND